MMAVPLLLVGFALVALWRWYETAREAADPGHTEPTSPGYDRCEYASYSLAPDGSVVGYLLYTWAPYAQRQQVAKQWVADPIVPYRSKLVVFCYFPTTTTSEEIATK
jgi:hypothetical protein